MSLDIRGLSVEVGGREVLSEVDVQLQPGEIACLVGDNGSGKTTLLRAISGWLESVSGSIQWKGRELVGAGCEQIVRRGVIRLFQNQHLAWNASVIENIALALADPSVLTWSSAVLRMQNQDLVEPAREVALRVGLELSETVLAANLSFGQQRLLALARVLAAGGELLLLDEPLHGLKDQARERVLAILEAERRSGRAIVVVEHDLVALAQLDATTWLLRDGKLSLQSPAVSKAEPESENDHRVRPSSGRPVLAVEHLAGGFGSHCVVRNVTLTVHPGEIVVVTGDNGSGKTTLLRLLAGLARPSSGCVVFAGHAITNWPAHRRFQAGLRYLPQGNRLIADLTIRQNMLLVNGRQTLSPGLSLRLGDRAATLSGGEATATALAALLAQRGELLLLDEPTAGLDSAARKRLLGQLLDAAEKGMAIVVVEHDRSLPRELPARYCHLRGGILNEVPST